MCAPRDRADADKLTLVRGLIAQGWAQYAPARSGDGAAVDALSIAAEAWSLEGACQVVHDPAVLYAVQSAIVAQHGDVIDTRGNARQNLIRWNDAPWRTLAEVLRVLDSAIKKF